MFLSGYPPEDLVMRDDFLNEIKKSIEQIIPQTDGISLILGAHIRKMSSYLMLLFLKDGN